LLICGVRALWFSPPRSPELVRSALRALACISISLEGAKKFVDFDMNVIQSDASLASKYNTIKAELLGASTSSMDDSPVY
jgi:hypothetical protein